MIPVLGDLSPRDYLLMLRERWHWGLVAGLLAAGGLLFHEWRKPELFRTESTLLFDATSDRVLNIEQVVDTDLRAGQSNPLSNHSEQILSASFLNFVAASFSRDELERIVAPYRTMEDGTPRTPNVGAVIRPNLGVAIRRNTSVIAITIKHRNPEVAAMIADRYARKYIDYHLDRSLTGTQSAIVFLQDQAHDLRREVEDTDRNLQRYRADHNLASLEEHQNVVMKRVVSLGHSLINAEVARLEIENRLRQVEEFMEKGESLTALPYISEHGSIPALLRERDELKKERAQLDERYLERHPSVLRSNLAIESVEKVLDQNIQASVSELRSRFAVAAEHEKTLRENLARAEKESLELDSIAVNYRIIERHAETARRSYDKVLDRLTETTIAGQLETTNIRILDHAWLPFKPSEPNMFKAAIQGGLLFCVLFFGIPIGAGLLDGRVKASWDVEEILGYPLLGEISALKKVKKKDRATVVLQGKQEIECECFRGLFSQLDLRSSLRYPKTLLITSSIPKEGKSLISNNLAATFATHGKKVLLLEMDLRRPMLVAYNEPDRAKKKKPGDGPRAGLLPWLDEKAPVPDRPREDPLLGIRALAENLDLLPAGRSEARPTVYFQKETFRALMESFKQHYDLIVVDSPPIGVFPDALQLARICDETLYVCRFNKVPSHRVKANLDLLGQSETNVLGVVLNGIPARRASMYHYYGYGSSDYRKYARHYAGAP